jgi:hypothetical protein
LTSNSHQYFLQKKAGYNGAVYPGRPPGPLGPPNRVGRVVRFVNSSGHRSTLTTCLQARVRHPSIHNGGWRHCFTLQGASNAVLGAVVSSVFMHAASLPHCAESTPCSAAADLSSVVFVCYTVSSAAEQAAMFSLHASCSFMQLRASPTAKLADRRTGATCTRHNHINSICPVCGCTAPVVAGSAEQELWVSHDVDCHH